MVLGGGDFGRWLGHEGGALMIGISVLINGTPESSLASSSMWGHNEKPAICNLEELSLEPNPAGTLISDLQPQNCEK